jgi:hypothetical protein
MSGDIGTSLVEFFEDSSLTKPRNQEEKSENNVKKGKESIY